MAGDKSTAGQLRAVRLVERALARLPPNHPGRTLAELEAITGVSVKRLRRLVPAMWAAGWKIDWEPHLTSPARVYFLARPDLREGEAARPDGTG